MFLFACYCTAKKGLPHFFYFGPQNTNILPLYTGDMSMYWLASS